MLCAVHSGVESLGEHLGQSELLATVIPGFPVVEVTPIAFVGRQVWLLALGPWWVAMKRRV